MSSESESDASDGAPDPAPDHPQEPSSPLPNPPQDASSPPPPLPEPTPKPNSTETIRVYCRIRPALHSAPTLEYTYLPPSTLLLRSPPSLEPAQEGFHRFTFSHVFEPSADQVCVFQDAAEGLVESVLDGYNATVFAYGQTGSGKTYTMTGGARYEERGVIPRALQKIFADVTKVGLGWVWLGG